MGLAISTVKQLLLLLNFIIAVLGIVLIGFGIFILVSGAENKVDHGEKLAGGVIIALGVLIVIITIFGCLAAIHESQRKLLVFIGSVIILILVQLLLASMASQGTKDGLTGSVHEGFDELWSYELNEPGALAYYEDWLHCCGVNNTDDYRRIRHDIPKTCCKDHKCLPLTNVYTEGCQEKFQEYLEGKMLTFSIVSWILIAIEIVDAVLGWLLLSKLRNQHRRSNVGWM